MALIEEQSQWAKEQQKKQEQKRRALLIKEYGPELGKALADSSLEVGAPEDEVLAKAIVNAFNAGTPEQQVKAIQAVLAYAKKAGQSAADEQYSKDHSLF